MQLSIATPTKSRVFMDIRLAHLRSKRSSHLSWCLALLVASSQESQCLNKEDNTEIFAEQR